jgi:hypothetical protein
MAAEPVIVSAAVEGVTDEAVVRKLIAMAGGRAGYVYGKNGKSALRQRIAGYANAAQFTPWVVLVDLNGEAPCPATLVQTWLPQPVPGLCFRVVVREVEAWLMADAASLARFLRIAQGQIPEDPDACMHPKELLVSLARGSRSRDVRADMVPRPGSGRSVGPAYTSRLVEFVELYWRPDHAAQHSESLRRATMCLRRLCAPSPSRR